MRDYPSMKEDNVLSESRPDLPDGCFVDITGNNPEKYKIVFNNRTKENETTNILNMLSQNISPNDVNNKPNTTGSSTMEFRRVCKIMDRKYYMFIYYRYTIIIF